MDELVLKEGVFLGEEQGEGILFDPDTMNTFWLNETAVEIISRLQKEKTRKQILEELTDLYEDVSENELNQDFDQLLEALKKNNFLGD